MAVKHISLSAALAGLQESLDHATTVTPVAEAILEGMKRMTGKLYPMLHAYQGQNILEMPAAAPPQAPAPDEKPAKTAKGKKKISEATRLAIVAAQKKRWSEHNRKKAEVAKAEAAKAKAAKLAKAAKAKKAEAGKKDKSMAA